MAIRILGSDYPDIGESGGGYPETGGAAVGDGGPSALTSAWWSSASPSWRSAYGF